MLWKIDYSMLWNLYVDFLEATFWSENQNVCWTSRVGNEFSVMRIPTW